MKGLLFHISPLLIQRILKILHIQGPKGNSIILIFLNNLHFLRLCTRWIAEQQQEALGARDAKENNPFADGFLLSAYVCAVFALALLKGSKFYS